MDTDVKKREGVDKKLPDGWKWVKLGDVAHLETGGTPSKSHSTYWNGNIPFVTGADIKDLYISSENSRAYLTEIGLNSGKTVICQPKTVLIVSRTRVGRAGIAKELMGISQDITACLCPPELLPEYLCRYLLSIGDSLLNQCRGSIIQGLRREDISSIKIPLPPLAEQKRIAAILNEQMEAVDKARKATEAQLDAAKQLPAAYLRAVFNSPEAQKWERKKLREICTGDGQYGTSELATSENIGLPILRMGNLSEGKITWNNLKYIQLPNSDEEKYKLQKGDIIFNRTNSAELVGKTAVFDDSRDAVFASYLIRFKVIETIANPNYVSVYINSSHGRRFIEANMARAIGQVNISASTMHKMPIPLPALNQQEKISQTLSNKMQSIDKLRCSLESQLEAINQLPAAIMRQAFNGKL